MNLATEIPTKCKHVIAHAFGVIAITTNKWKNPVSQTVTQPVSQEVDEHSLVEEANPVFIGNMPMEVTNG